jgi:hypothetical protein
MLKVNYIINGKDEFFDCLKLPDNNGNILIIAKYAETFTLDFKE